MNRETLAIVASMVLAAPALCDNRIDDATLTAHAKAIDIAVLDKALPAEQFDRWLLSGPARIEKLEYLPGDCDLKPTREEPKEGWPLCVKVILRRGELWGACAHYRREYARRHSW